MTTPRFQLADELLRRFAGALRSTQLYSKGHPIIGRNLDALSAAIQLLRTLKQSDTVTRLGSVADVDVGIVTGRNSFFTFTDAQAHELGLRPHCVPLVSRSAQLSGLVYDSDCRASDLAAGHRTWLLDAPHDPTDPALVAHIDAGDSFDFLLERIGVVGEQLPMKVLHLSSAGRTLGQSLLGR